MPILLNNPRCDLIVMSVAPEAGNLGALPIHSNSAYIRVDESELYYVCKSRLKCSSIDVTREALAAFDERLHPSRICRTLNSEEVEALIGGGLIPGYFHEPVRLCDQIREAGTVAMVDDFAIPHSNVAEYIQAGYHLVLLFKAIQKELAIQSIGVAVGQVSELESDIRHIRKLLDIVKKKDYGGVIPAGLNERFPELSEFHITTVNRLRECGGHISRLCTTFETECTRLKSEESRKIEQVPHRRSLKKFYIIGGVLAGIIFTGGVAVLVIGLTGGFAAPIVVPVAAVTTKGLLAAGAVATTATAASTAAPIVTGVAAGLMGGGAALGTTVGVVSVASARGKIRAGTSDPKLLSSQDGPDQADNELEKRFNAVKTALELKLTAPFLEEMARNLKLKSAIDASASVA